MNNIVIINKGGEEIHIDTESRKVVLVVRNGRNYKSARYLNNPYYWGIAEEYFESAEAESAEADEVQEEVGDLQDVVVNLYDGHIGRIVGMRIGKYRIVMSTGKLVELDRNEFYLDNEEPIAVESKDNDTTSIKIGYYNYEVFENQYVIRFTCRALDRQFIYNKKFKDFKLLQISTNRFLSAKRYYNNYYNIIGQLHEYVNKGA